MKRTVDSIDVIVEASKLLCDNNTKKLRLNECLKDTKDTNEKNTCSKSNDYTELLISENCRLRKEIVLLKESLITEKFHYNKTVESLISLKKKLIQLLDS